MSEAVEGVGLAPARRPARRRSRGPRRRVLVLNDRLAFRRELVARLRAAGFEATTASDEAEAWVCFRGAEPDLVVADVDVGGGSGLGLVARIRAHSEVPLVAFSFRDSVETAVAALKAGADDFVSAAGPTPQGIADRARALADTRDDPAEPGDLPIRLVGTSPAIVTARRRLAGLAPLRAPVLFVGEAGSGRRTAATAIHELGSTAGRHFQHLDAAGFSARDAVPLRGVVYLDGVDRLDRDGQAYWADWLGRAQARCFEDGPRILASSFQPLAPLAAAGGYHPRLAELLGRFLIELPPLRDRASDIPALADALLERLGTRLGRRAVRLSGSARSYLSAMSWPGNVGQLEEVLERALAFSRGREVPRRAVEEVVGEIEDSLASIRARYLAREREDLLEAIRETGGNVTHTAEKLGRSRSAVYRLITKHGVRLTRRG